MTVSSINERKVDAQTFEINLSVLVLLVLVIIYYRGLKNMGSSIAFESVNFRPFQK